MMVLAFIAGMFAGSILILVFGAIAAAAQQSRNEEFQEIEERNKAYIAKLERELYGWKQGDE